MSKFKFQIKDRKTEPVLRRAIDGDDADTLDAILAEIVGSGNSHRLPSLCLNNGDHFLAAAVTARAHKCIDAYIRTAVSASSEADAWDQDNRWVFLEAILKSDVALDVANEFLAMPWLPTTGLIESVIHQGRGTGHRRLHILKQSLEVVDAGTEFSDWLSGVAIFRDLCEPLDLPCLQVLLDTAADAIGGKLFRYVLKHLSTSTLPEWDVSARDLVARLLLRYPQARDVAVRPEATMAGWSLAEYGECVDLTRAVANEIRHAHPERNHERSMSAPVIALLAHSGLPVQNGRWAVDDLFHLFSTEELVKLYRNGACVSGIVHDLYRNDDADKAVAFFKALEAGRHKFSRKDLFAFLQVPACVEQVMTYLEPWEIQFPQAVWLLRDRGVHDVDSAETFRTLAASGVNFLDMHSGGNSLLHALILRAPEKGQLVSAMIDAGFDPNQPNGASYRPLQCALLSTRELTDSGENHAAAVCDLVRQLIDCDAQVALASGGRAGFFDLLDECMAADPDAAHVFQQLARELSASNARKHVTVVRRGKRFGL